VLALFVVPAVIVVAIVAVWVSLYWVAYKNEDAFRLAENLNGSSASRWQAASSLADMLRTPGNPASKDPKLAAHLARILEKELSSQSWTDEEVRLRGFLCRALGEFEVTEGLPVLLKAAALTPDSGDQGLADQQRVVKRSAIEGMARLAGRVGSEKLAENTAVIPTLIRAAPLDAREWAIGSAAAYALGVIGGEAALDHLVSLLRHPHPNVRQNAACGLARWGDARGEAVLAEMLDERPLKFQDPVRLTTDEIESRQDVIDRIQTALAAITRMAEVNPEARLSGVEAELGRLAESGTDAGLRLRARGALNVLADRKSSAVP
jgi:HEAT repeat protein